MTHRKFSYLFAANACLGSFVAVARLLEHSWWYAAFDLLLTLFFACLAAHESALHAASLTATNGVAP